MLWVGLGAWAQLDGCGSVREREEKREKGRKMREELGAGLSVFCQYFCPLKILLYEGF